MAENRINAKAFLSQAYLPLTRIEKKIEEAQRIRSIVEKCTVSYGGNISNGTKDPHSGEALLCSLIDLENEIKKDVEELASGYKAVLETLSKIEDGELRTVLELKYLLHKRVTEIGKELHVSKTQFYRIHDRAISALDRKLNPI